MLTDRLVTETRQSFENRASRYLWHKAAVAKVGLGKDNKGVPVAEIYISVELELELCCFTTSRSPSSV